ncbi:MAG: TonB-dependent receptor [Alphaproteobacteria bacterium]|jgi:outer membrane receptor protein involved in Fe transport|nr:TonB-dependent receptor [Alphaproteobacteria bacterium]
MYRASLLASVAIGAILSAGTPALAQIMNNSSGSIETVVVTAQRLNAARSGIQTQTGASTYTITSRDIEAQPGGANSLLNQVVLQAPGVAQDSFGQLHVRGEHNGLQYRLNGIILPEGISAFGQTLNPRLISSLQLVTGALPAEYGLRTAGIVNLHTRNGLFDSGGDISIYGGSHSTIQPSFDYGGSSGSFNYFVSGDFLTNTLGIESPDGRSNPLHDRTQQYHGFAYLEDILDEHSSITAVLGTSHGQFQIPNQAGLQPELGWTLNGQTSFPSAQLDENQSEITHYGIVSYLRSEGGFDFQISGFGRYSSLLFTPDAVGDLLFDGIAQNAYKRDVTLGTQAEGALHVGDNHTIRAGLVIQSDTTASRTTSQVLPADCTGTGTLADPFACAPLTATNPAYDIPISIPDNSSKQGWTYSVYLQDEWKVTKSLTLNYGLRFDQFNGFLDENQLSPRINAVWKPTATTTVHAGYSRYFSPPPFELVGNETVVKFLNTSASPMITANDTPRAERAHYFDIGIDQQIIDGLILGVDTYYKASRNMLDEGQFGAPIIQTPFNYKDGRQYGVELTGTYDSGPFSTYANVAFQRAQGRDIVTSQFDFSPEELAYIAGNFIHLDHEQYTTISAGASYLWQNTRFSADLLYGSGLRREGLVPNGDHVPGYAQINLGVSHAFDLASAGVLTLRVDVINVLNTKYQIRDGTGVGVGAPQYGPRRGFFFGVSKSL